MLLHNLADDEQIGLLGGVIHTTGYPRSASSEPTKVVQTATRVRHTVHIVAESAQERASIARLIFSAGHHAEVYSDGLELTEHRPTEGIVLVHEHGSFGTAAMCRLIADNGLWLPVIGFGAEIAADRIIAGMRAGALDFIIGEVSHDQLQAKLDECSRDASMLNSMRVRQANAKVLLSRLSQRERQVLDLVAGGHSNKAIARQLDISPRTVEIHRMKMIGKLGASSSVDAVRIHFDGLC